MRNLILLLLVMSSDLWAATLAGRHVYIIHPGMDTIWGSYMLVVEREQEGEKESAKFELILPRETEDFSPQQGIEKDNVKLKPDGGLEVEAEFERPQTLVVTGFKVAGSNGKVRMTMKLPFDVGEFSIMALEGRVKIDSPQFEYKGPIDFSGSKYDTWTVIAPKAGTDLAINVSGVPEGRRNFYILGGIFALLLLAVTILLTIKSKPALDRHESEFETVNA